LERFAKKERSVVRQMSSWYWCPKYFKYWRCLTAA